MTYRDTPTPELERLLAQLRNAQTEATEDNRRRAQHLRLQIGAVEYVLETRKAPA